MFVAVTTDNVGQGSIGDGTEFFTVRQYLPYNFPYESLINYWFWTCFFFLHVQPAVPRLWDSKTFAKVSNTVFPHEVSPSRLLSHPDVLPPLLFIHLCSIMYFVILYDMLVKYIRNYNAHTYVRMCIVCMYVRMYTCLYVWSSCHSQPPHIYALDLLFTSPVLWTLNQRPLPLLSSYLQKDWQEWVCMKWVWWPNLSPDLASQVVPT